MYTSDPNRKFGTIAQALQLGLIVVSLVSIPVAVVRGSGVLAVSALGWIALRAIDRAFWWSRLE